MMELIINGPELQALADKGLLNDIIKSCTFAGPDEEEKPKKKATRKKKEEKSVVTAIFEGKVNNGFPQEEPTVADPTVPTMDAPKEEPAPVAVPEPVKDEAKPAINLEGLAQRAIVLMDSGKGAELQALLQQFGVNSLPELQPEQYSGFMAALEEMEG